MGRVGLLGRWWDELLMILLHQKKKKKERKRKRKKKSKCRSCAFVSRALKELWG
jgi:hypothetical protein